MLAKKVVVIVGGVGGAKLAFGLSKVVTPENLSVIVNTGDDFWHYGLKICPDIDTVLYTLSGRADPVQGWGLAGDSTVMLETLANLGEDPWFRLGDKDLATHLLRTHLLREGKTLTDVIGILAQRMGIEARILPMTDDPAATIVDTVEYGELAFQDYFVRHRWQPTVKNLIYSGSHNASVTKTVYNVINEADVILFGPSNPWLSIAPVLNVSEMRALLLKQSVPRIAVTPIVEGKAIKGPAAKLMKELGFMVSAESVAQYYGELITGFVYDERDATPFLENKVIIAMDTVMKQDADKIALSQQILNWIFTKEL